MYPLLLGKAMIITFSECMSVQHAMWIGRIELSPVDCLALSYFSSLSHKNTIFGKGHGT